MIGSYSDAYTVLAYRRAPISIFTVDIPIPNIFTYFFSFAISSSLRRTPTSYPLATTRRSQRVALKIAIISWRSQTYRDRTIPNDANERVGECRGLSEKFREELVIPTRDVK